MSHEQRLGAKPKKKLNYYMLRIAEDKFYQKLF